MYKDYFSLFKLKPQFSINMQTLEQNYIALQSNYHPDLFSLKLEKKLALDTITEINKAYQTLKSSIKRAEYLLEIKGITTNKNDINILEEIFNIQESNSIDLQNQILLSTKAMENAFSVEDFNEAAKQVVRLKYLKKIQEDRSITSCN
ncbi:fe-S protein assembly co-chaperone HscB [Ehrlichia chaffeensis str. Heartland]|uniref:Co-chaperone Hsc20 n=2 Tax=Ehrlichia chaffeensis TaxID=945 RepID=Q2GGJ1_EHRCR|nr:co-chaperone Hsc20 [Ehrlichia chaffeensis str. Arkansas]AHX03713.1 fe-S protein assembly co-chaperone HscB [Ehrlichia chaffeensis str. Heartland]AHX05566.1 fe-S protein assembly co-chaperone HscB [Ehrlichia chaffeensis str. Jax]AHX06556.1 fe-S protein assembly co-chaperone HscB [Ehrlichia chaffeensis str. Liberty]AHX07701.1 fe-S protein assembly co-chaperone HscB [Ehrlichia chaffeensis str. Osceola]AHX08502.1 fe-S protein assembly co-chaperone HscB [Ehrlichia chaffeensis str. Saint Vincent]